MLLAQVDLVPVEHANALYQQWGLVSSVFALIVALLTFIWWLTEKRRDDTTAPMLAIKSKLVAEFQSTVIEESLRLFDLVDNRLPIVLSQSEQAIANPSAFDRLAIELSQLNVQDPNRERYKVLIEHALSGIVVSEIRKLLQSVNTYSAILDDGAGYSGVRLAFEKDTERTLTLIAEKTAQANRKQKHSQQLWRGTFYGSVGAVATGFLSTIFAFLDYAWCYYAYLVLLVLLALCGAFSVLCFAISNKFRHWILDTAQQTSVSCTPLDIRGEGSC